MVVVGCLLVCGVEVWKMYFAIFESIMNFKIRLLGFGCFDRYFDVVVWRLQSRTHILSHKTED